MQLFGAAFPVGAPRRQVSAQEESNKAAARRFSHATNTGDAELISKTIDELVEHHALIRTPLPLGTTGAQKVKEVFAGSIGAAPAFTSRSRI